MRNELKREIAKYLSFEVAKQHGFGEIWLPAIENVLYQWMVGGEDEYVIRKAMYDIFDGIGAGEAPWSDPKWFNPVKETKNG